MNSASGSMNRRISHGHATRSTLIFSRVIHFIESLQLWRYGRSYIMIRPYHAKWKVHYGTRSRHHTQFQAAVEKPRFRCGGNPDSGPGNRREFNNLHSGQFDPASATPVQELGWARVDLVHPNGP